MSGNSTIYSVDLKNLGRGGQMPLPQPLFRACPATKALGSALLNEAYQYNFDTLDGERFLVNCVAEPPGRYQVVMNWAAK